MTEKILSYACLYKADTGAVDEILDTDITITLIREKRLFPMQIIVTGEFAENSHIWLKALTRSMDIKQAEELLDHYERIQETNPLNIQSRSGSKFYKLLFFL